MIAVVRAELTDRPIDAAEHEALVAHHAAGAVVSFAGVVRDHDGGRTVTRLEYSAHPSAGQTLADVVGAVAAECDGVRAIAVSHRVGSLQIGDAALIAVVAADHRRRGVSDVRATGRPCQRAPTGVETPVLRRRQRRVGQLRVAELRPAAATGRAQVRAQAQVRAAVLRGRPALRARAARTGPAPPDRWSAAAA